MTLCPNVLILEHLLADINHISLGFLDVVEQYIVVGVWG
jgi:hypothetical protein